jgi:hypothetical protein
MGYKTREERLAYSKEYYAKNKDKNSRDCKLYRLKNKDKIKLLNKNWRRKTQGTWEGYIPKETICQICGKPIFFNQNNIENAIHFDHKDEFAPIKCTPTLWLSTNRRTAETEKIFEACKFGMLCRRCNRLLPTKNRNKVINYLLGKSNV